MKEISGKLHSVTTVQTVSILTVFIAISETERKLEIVLLSPFQSRRSIRVKSPDPAPTGIKHYVTLRIIITPPKAAGVREGTFARV